MTREFLRQWINTLAPVRHWLGLFRLPRYVRHWQTYQRLSGRRLRLSDSYPVLTDWVSATPFDPHYFYQGAWLARRLAARTPGLHVDVGSSVLAMSVLSGHVPTVFVDYRPLKAKLKNLQSLAGSILSLPFASGGIASLSCLHVLEHIGLGRYGDPLDPEGSSKAAGELVRVVALGGSLYLAVPVGKPRICFNAHRIFSPTDVSFMFPGLTLVEFSWVDDAGCLHVAGRPEDAVDAHYACGLYEFAREDND